jgi:hypothetical protein
MNIAKRAKSEKHKQEFKNMLQLRKQSLLQSAVSDSQSYEVVSSSIDEPPGQGRFHESALRINLFFIIALIYLMFLGMLLTKVAF